MNHLLNWIIVLLWCFWTQL